ncbi:MAG: hypothetical protein EOL98_13275 [Negativicutes bacterium]|nr:hypothetical protein [Negativicutes bacterium]
MGTNLSSLGSAYSMYPLPPSVWQNPSPEWVINRCLFLINLRHSRNDYFHGGDLEEDDVDFNAFIDRKLTMSFMNELNFVMTEYESVYDEIWYQRFFGD